MDCGNDFSGKCHGTHDDEFLRDILLQQPPAAFSSESESDHSFRPVVQNTTITNDGAVKSNSSQISSKRPRPLSTPRTYILSFDNSTMVPATPETRPRSSNNSPLPAKRALESPGPVARRPNQGAKKIRTSSQTIDHIMAERRRRQDLTERFIALSATIPGLSKVINSFI